MRSSFRFLLPIIAALLGLFAASAPAYGQIVTTTFGPFTITCTPSGQLCDNTFSQSVGTISTLRVQYVASAGHCSNVAAHILVDGVEKAVTAFLTPGQASGFFDVGPVSAGSHVVTLRAEGTVSGCNTGNLLNWGGTMDVTHDAAVAAPAAAVPTLPAQTLGVLAVALLAAASWAIRRRKP